MLKYLIYNPLNKYYKILKKIDIIYQSINKYSNKELKEQTYKLQKIVKNTNTKIEDLMPEAFATIKEAIKRATGLTLFDVQILGGIVLHYGNIAEMKTGEGKTIAAILPSYLNSLTKKGVHIVTVNDYLAKRDYNLAEKIFKYLDINVGLILNNLKYEKRKIEYNADIIYITNNELGFDYLRDNMSIDEKDIVQRDFNYAIIDEVDSILIDEARTPLIISGPSENNTNKYIQAYKISKFLQNNIHYEIDEKSRNIILTEEGIIKCEEELNINNLYNIDNPWIRYLLNALKAKELFINNKDYIIKNNKIIIVDEFTGRLMDGRRWSDGLHQAIEAKENLKIESENKTLASITYQNLFLLYNKLSGMTGTAKTEEEELYKIYKLSVIEIPSNKNCQRKDLPDLVYKSEYYKWEAIANECFDMYQIGRPTLIGTTSIEKSELLAQMLNSLKIPYNLLNAKPENITRESEIIAQAGQKKAITISTNMAGRGTDILLGGNPSMMAKITIIDFIKQMNKIKSNIKTQININQYKNNNIINFLNQITITNLNDYKKEQNIEKFIDQIINDNASYKTQNKEMFNIYISIKNEYKKLLNNEKKDVQKLGGLYVIGTERHESRRIDNQLRGRSGRQGDQGSSRFFLSLQDNLFRIFGGEKVEKIMTTLNIDEKIPIESKILSQSLNAAQKKVESYFYDVRKQLFEYDEVINSQRQAIYAERKRILKSSFTRDCILEYGENTIDEIFNIYSKENTKNKKIKIIKQIFQLFNLTTELNAHEINKMNDNECKNFFYEQFRITYDLRESYLEELRPGLIRQLEKYYLLQQIDKAWQEHLEKMSLLKEYIGWRSYGQQDPLIEYKNEAFNLFINMVIYIRQTVIYLTMRSRLIINL